MKWSYLTTIGILIGLWLFTVVIKVQPFLVPPPNLVVSVLWVEREVFLQHGIRTVSIGLVGYLVANGLGIALAIAFYYVPWLEAFVNPWIVFITRIPFIVFSSIFVVVFRTTVVPQIIIVVLVTIFTIVANVSEGLRSADPVLLDRMKVLHASRLQVFRKVLWAAAKPYFIAAQLIAFTGMVIAMIVAEYQYGSEGLGFLLLRGQQQYRMDKLYAVAIIVSGLSVGIYILIKAYQSYELKKRRIVTRGQ
ncbi:ABC transporter permease subunit [Candidatus Gottesmanbacteria bacterium]|nr:ABC transporter permease subunit [Candidatus Gottesmanbacteria bacterium]